MCLARVRLVFSCNRLNNQGYGFHEGVMVLSWSKKAWWIGSVGVLIGAARWWAQRSSVGTGAVYTDSDQQFYVQDSLLGWKKTEETFFWLGLDVLGVLLGAAVALALGARFVLREERGTLARVLSPVALLTSLAICVVPIIAWASGLPPEHSTVTAPELAGDFEGGAAGFDSGTPGTYAVVPSAGELESTVIARISAGKETFDARFSAPQGQVTFDPTALMSSAVQARFTVDVTSLDTGVKLRSESARDYLKVNTHDTLVLELLELNKASQNPDNPREVSFSALAKLQIMGQEVQIDLSGVLVQLGPEETAQLDLQVGPERYILRASFTLDMRETPLKADIDAFDEPTTPLQVRVLLELQPS